MPPSAALASFRLTADVIFERFFDEAGAQHLVVHAPFGARINRAWGLALRKRFCARFDFELQAAAADDAIVLSLGPAQSFPLEEAFGYLRSHTARESLQQAILYSPQFGTRWRWNATRALAVERQRGSRKVPPPIQRMRADDLLAAVFPAQVGCQENAGGPLDIPDHPLIAQTLHDCLYEAMDLDGLLAILEKIEGGKIRLHARDTTEPSPMAHEVLNAKPYAFLDDAPLEERRTRAVMLRHSLPTDARDLAALDPDAIRRVREEAWPAPRDVEECHDALLGLVAVRDTLVADWAPWLETLVAGGRAAAAVAAHARLWFAAENLPLVQQLYPEARAEPAVALPVGAAASVEDRDDARRRLLRGHTEARGPVTVAMLVESSALSEEDIQRGLAQIEALGHVLRGRFTTTGAPGHPLSPVLSGDGNGHRGTLAAIGPAPIEEFCDRRLLARIHRYTLDRLRKEIDPVSAQDFMRFLLRWQHIAPGTRLEGRAGVREAIRQLQGFEAPAVSWERDLLPARVAGLRSRLP